MTPVTFPFAALVGLDTLKLALQLAALDRRLSVLIRGDKGAGKSTAARGLVDLLDDGAPFVNLPIGATEDRLLGGLDLEKTIGGEPALKRGLLAEANGGVLYVDEVNLLPDHLADALLDAAASGTLVVEREGFSATQAADFVMLGSMNPEEGALRPQLLDRFALVVDVEAPMDPVVRGTVLERRLAYDANAQRFGGEWRDAQRLLAEQMIAARGLLPQVSVSREMLHYVAARVAEHDVRSLRADLAVVRAARAFAALMACCRSDEADSPSPLGPLSPGRGGETHASGAMARADAAAVACAAVGTEVTEAHVEAVLPLALAHRMRRASPPPRSTAPPPPPSPPSSAENGDADGSGDADAEASSDTCDPGDPSDRGDGGALERTFVAVAVSAPRLIVDCATERAGRNRAAASGGAVTGPVAAARQTTSPRELDARASVAHAVARTGVAQLDIADLHERVRRPRRSTRYIFIVDSSGSHAAQDRMRLVKGAVNGLLDESHGRHDEVVLIACRGAAATVLLEPTSSRADAVRQLEYLPTGGRTPLAHALELAAAFVTDHAIVVLVTDGHANVPTRSEDAWEDAQSAARLLGCPALIVDTEDPRAATGRPRELAEAMGGTHVRIADLDQAAIIRLIAEGA